VPGDDLELRVAWLQYVSSSPAGIRSFENVLARHRQSHRRYHGVRHLRWVVRHALELIEAPRSGQTGAGQTGARDAGVIVAAAFFHDVVYDVTRSDNEAASARVATQSLIELGWEPDRVDRVASIILATATHTSQPGDLDTAMLLAADLAVLAAEPSAYGDYVRGVRREYTHVNDADWRAGRSGLLRGLLQREHIYDPGLGLDRWELRARANIAAELAELAAGTNQTAVSGDESHGHDAEPAP
jgi:predicted metal-dependent HD superfamily phosphohydrolase